MRNETPIKILNIAKRTVFLRKNTVPFFSYLLTNGFYHLCSGELPVGATGAGLLVQSTL